MKIEIKDKDLIKEAMREVLKEGYFQDLVKKAVRKYFDKHNEEVYKEAKDSYRNSKLSAEEERFLENIKKHTIQDVISYIKENSKNLYSHVGKMTFNATKESYLQGFNEGMEKGRETASQKIIEEKNR